MKFSKGNSLIKWKLFLFSTGNVSRAPREMTLIEFLRTRQPWFVMQLASLSWSHFQSYSPTSGIKNICFQGSHPHERLPSAGRMACRCRQQRVHAKPQTAAVSQLRKQRMPRVTKWNGEWDRKYKEWCKIILKMYKIGLNRTKKEKLNNRRWWDIASMSRITSSSEAILMEVQWQQTDLTSILFKAVEGLVMSDEVTRATAILRLLCPGRKRCTLLVLRAV